MQDNFPDAITCGNGVIYYLEFYNPADGKQYTAMNGPTAKDIIYFNNTEGGFARSNHAVDSKLCNGKSLLTLYHECQAFNFVKRRPNNVTGKNTDLFTADWPHVIECNSEGGRIQPFYLSIKNNRFANQIEYKKNHGHSDYYKFNSDGSYNAGAADGHELGCANKSITQISNENRAYHFSVDPLIDS